MSVNYFQEISSAQDEHLHTSPWAGCLIKNCDQTGAALNFKSISEYETFRKHKRSLWLYMPLKVFKFSGFTLFGVYVCPECSSMASVKGLSSSQDPASSSGKHNQKIINTY